MFIDRYGDAEIYAPLCYAIIEAARAALGVKSAICFARRRDGAIAARDTR